MTGKNRNTDTIQAVTRATLSIRVGELCDEIDELQDEQQTRRRAYNAIRAKLHRKENEWADLVTLLSELKEE